MKLIDKIGYILVYVAIVLWGTIIILTPLKIIGASQFILDCTMLLSSFFIASYISTKDTPNRFLDMINKGE